MNPQTKTCQNNGISKYCEGDFTITSDDFAFYEKIKVPPPTFCPTCRFQRRILFRNECNLYRRNCDLCKKDIITVFAPEKKHIVYCGKCWWGDDWDVLEHGISFDETKPFFDQLKELSHRVPLPDRIVDHSTLINSDYINHAGSCKNCTLVYNADFCEDVLYSSAVVHTRDSLDIHGGDNVELSYELTNAEKCNKCFFSKSLTSCIETYFSRDCVGCMNCFGCINLRNKSYYVFNQQVTKEEFENILNHYKLNTQNGIDRAIHDSEEFFKKFPKRYVYGQKNSNSSGNYVYNSKNAFHCWNGSSYEDCAYCQFSTLAFTRDTYDLTEWGNNVEQTIDSITVGEGANNIKYSYAVWNNVRNVTYSMLCASGVNNLFGCIGVRNKSYCILNKQYTKEEYESLVPKILENIEKHCVTDLQGRHWKYGEFLPYYLSLFDYNESWAMQHFPLAREEALHSGFTWRDIPSNTYTTTMNAKNLPDILSTSQNILNEIIECVHCKNAYKILPNEYAFLKRFSLALPQQCPKCRAQKRLKKIGTPQLFTRYCDKCHISIESAYPENSMDIVYCEKCYQEEVI